MGTNYYVRENVCCKCGRYEEKHVGKKSAGWVFMVRTYQEIPNWEAWKKRLPLVIYDEYGKAWLKHRLIKMVETKGPDDMQRIRAADVVVRETWNECRRPFA